MEEYLWNEEAKKSYIYARTGRVAAARRRNLEVLVNKQ